MRLWLQLEAHLGGVRTGLALAFARRRYRAAAVLIALLYAGLYLYAVGQVVHLPQVDLSRFSPVPSLALSEDWTVKLWRARAPFVWEPIGALYLTRHTLVLLAVPNLLLGLALGSLVGINLTLGLWALLSLGGRRAAGSWKGLLGALPGLLTGFACCAPTVVLALGSAAAGVTAGVIAVRPFLVPLSFVILGGGALWSAGRLARGSTCSLDR